MDAIIKAGGAGKAKLKSAKDRKIEKKKEQKEEKKVGGGGDLMGDLAAKLAMRRKGISGTKQQGGKPEESAGNGNALGKMSDMIPHIPKAAAGETGGEEDWD